MDFTIEVVFNGAGGPGASLKQGFDVLLQVPVLTLEDRVGD
jgi:hypothetical protein